MHNNTNIHLPVYASEEASYEAKGYQLEGDGAIMLRLSVSTHRNHSQVASQEITFFNCSFEFLDNLDDAIAEAKRVLREQTVSKDQVKLDV